MTINEVAAVAGVSRATVSKYMADADVYYVAEATRARIAAAIEELGYEPNAMARGLSNRRSKTIGVMVPSFLNPYYPSLMAGMSDVADEAGYTLVFGSSDDSAVREKQIISSFRQRQVEGVLLAAVPKEAGALSALVEADVEVVLVSRAAAHFAADTVLIDDAGGMRSALDHLRGHGHSAIWHLAGPDQVGTFHNRAEAYRSYMDEQGVAESSQGLVQADHATMEGGERVAEAIFAEGSPTAIIAANDLLALGVMNYCARVGKKVPEDLAVVGFDNVWVSRVPGVQLTTVDGRIREIGQMAARRVLERILARWDSDNGQSLPAKSVILPADLVVRNTCGCGSGASQASQ
ncbi:LacI family DNA-binding transcriptional regulator [Demequina aurantiaca]|uniref:LacI family DNA-binding transcriptional regulator n=1 Tax=Demequina aurantiaca TaxID=676200 RepID=UPI003D3347C0